MDGTLNVFASFVVLSYFVPLALFIAFYATRSPWASTELGVALMFQKIGFVVVIVVVTTGLFFGQYPGREWVRLFAYLFVGFFLWVDVWNLRRYQRRYPLNRKKRRRRSVREIILQQFKN